MALMAWSLLSVLAGLGKAMDGGGTSLSTVAPGRESLVVWGKIGLPGSGCGARLVLREATLVLMTRVFLRSAARLELLTRDIPGVLGSSPGVFEV